MWPFGGQVEGSLEKVLQISGPVKLEVETASGDITVSSGGDGRVRIKARFQVRAASEAEAQRLAEQIEADPPIKQIGNMVKIGDRDKYDSGGRVRHPSIMIDYEIEAPVQTSVQLDSGSGDQHISGLKGPAWADTGSGDVVITDIQTEVKVDAGSGDVNLAHVSGDVDIHVSSGDVVLRDVGGDVEVDTGSGDIRVSSAIGEGASWELDTGSGDVELTLPRGARFTLQAETSTGEIESDFPLRSSERAKRGSADEVGEALISKIEVETGSGDIKIKAG